MLVSSEQVPKGTVHVGRERGRCVNLSHVDTLYRPRVHLQPTVILW